VDGMRVENRTRCHPQPSRPLVEVDHEDLSGGSPFDPTPFLEL
jgi:hypothetical protein